MGSVQDCILEKWWLFWWHPNPHSCPPPGVKGRSTAPDHWKLQPCATAADPSRPQPSPACAGGVCNVCRSSVKALPAKVHTKCWPKFKIQRFTNLSPLRSNLNYLLLSCWVLVLSHVCWHSLPFHRFAYMCNTNTDSITIWLKTDSRYGSNDKDLKKSNIEIF